MDRHRKQSTWPFLCVLAVFFALSAAAPRAWEKTVRGRTFPLPAADQLAVRGAPARGQSDAPAPPEPVVETPISLVSVSVGQVASFDQGPTESMPSTTTSCGLLMVAARPHIGSVSPTLVEQDALWNFMDEESSTATLTEGESLSEDEAFAATLEDDAQSPALSPDEDDPTAPDPEASPASELPADSAPALAAPAVARPEPVDDRDLSAVAGVSAIDPDKVPALAAALPSQRDRLSLDAALTEPVSILVLLEPLGWECGTGRWAREMAHEVCGAAEALAAESPDADARIARLEKLSLEGELLYAERKGTTEAAQIRSAWEMIRRRIAVWEQLAEALRLEPTYSDPVDWGHFRSCAGRMAWQLDGDANGLAWRNFLELERLVELAADKPSTLAAADRNLARTILLKLHAAELSPEQRSFVESQPVVDLRQCLHEIATEPVRGATIVQCVEAFERIHSASSGERLAAERLKLAMSTRPAHTQLAACIEQFYCGPNIRISVTGDLLNRMIPDRAPEYQWVRDSVMGHPIRGRSLNSADVGLELIPDAQRLRAALTVQGHVAASTSSTAGPATFFSDSQTEYVAAKELELTPSGVHFQPAEIRVDNQMQLRGIRTGFDTFPLLGSIAHEMARNQHEKNSAAIRREVRQKVHMQARRQIDDEVDARLGELNQRFKDRLLDPLAEMSLRPVVMEAKTTESRVTTQLQLAGIGQLGSHTPRPWAPADSLLSCQVHQSALNNVLEQLELNGATLTIKQLRQRIAERFHRPEMLEQETEHDDVLITFAARDAARVDFEEGRLAVSLGIKRLSKAPHEWNDFRVRAYYRPEITDRSACLVRDGVVELIGRGGTGSQIVLRGIFSKTFSKDRTWPVVPAEMAADSRLSGLEITQLAIENGWFGLAIGPERAEPRVAGRAGAPAQ